MNFRLNTLSAKKFGGKQKIETLNNINKSSLKFWRRASSFLEFMIILFISNVSDVSASGAHTYVNVYTGTAGLVTASTLRVEKVIQGVGTDADNHYVLAWGYNSNNTHNDHGLTIVTKYDNSGTAIWSNYYSVSSSGGPGLTYLLGYCIAADNGSSNTGNIAVGGYTLMDGVDDENFVMELSKSTGAVSWFKHWGNPLFPSYESSGIKDLLYNHETGTNIGSITALSDEQGSSTVFNLFVYVINSTGILASEQLTDTYDYGFTYAQTPGSNPVEGVDIKPRIVESVTNSRYYIVGNREYPHFGNFWPSTGTRNEIAFWTVLYGPSAASFTAYYSTVTSSPEVEAYVTGAVEDDGTYTPSGNPEVFLSGFIMDGSNLAANGDTVARPLVIEVSSLATPTFSSLEIPGSGLNLYLSNINGYMYPTDIAIVSTQVGSYYQLMMPVSYYQGHSTNKMYIFTVPMNLSSHPNSKYYLVRNSGSAISGEFGGICSTDSSERYIVAGNDFTNDVVICHANSLLTFCDPDTTVATSCPASSTSIGGLGSTVTPNPFAVTPGDTSMSSVSQNLCGVYIPPPTSPETRKDFLPDVTNADQQAANGLVSSTNKSNPLIDIYPNPVSNNTWLDIKNCIPSTAQISIVDMAGKIIISQCADLSSGLNHISVDTRTLSSGLYMLKVSSSDQSVNTSIRIQKY